MTTVYIVRGTSGEWADVSTWDVCFRFTKEDADAICRRCQQEGDEYFKWRYPKKPSHKRLTALEQEEWLWEDKRRRESVFDKNMSCDYTGIRYTVGTLSEDPAVDPDCMARKASWAKWEADRLAEQMKFCTVEDRTPISTNLGEVLKRKLTIT